MAKIYLSRLIDKYDFKSDEITGVNYRKLMQDIITNQTENIAKLTTRISNRNYVEQMAKVKIDEKKMILPNLKEVFPKRSIFIRKGAEDGDLVTDKLRDQLTKNLRNSLEEFKTLGGKDAYIRRAGKLAGTINPKVIQLFQDKITKTFENYTKSDDKYGMPSNIHSIAVTEIRSTINTVKSEYNNKLYEKNKDKFDFWKMWRHNRRLSIKPRKGHQNLDGKKIRINEMFDVEIWQDGKIIDIEKMRFPHDPNASAENLISCNCDIIYFATPKSQNIS